MNNWKYDPITGAEITSASDKPVTVDDFKEFCDRLTKADFNHKTGGVYRAILGCTVDKKKDNVFIVTIVSTGVDANAVRKAIDSYVYHLSTNLNLFGVVSSKAVVIGNVPVLTDAFEVRRTEN